MPDNSFEENAPIPRAEQDRRQSQSESLPYFTEEGMVMVDRREGAERRKKLFYAPDLAAILGVS